MMEGPALPALLLLLSSLLGLWICSGDPMDLSVLVLLLLALSLLLLKAGPLLRSLGLGGE